MRFVFDTNVLIDGFQDDFSAQAKLIDAVRDGEITALVIPKVMNEYRLILRRLISDPNYKDRIEDFFTMTEMVNSADADVVIDDQEDYKFIQTALGGQAEYIITNDRHLLDIGEVEDIRIVSPKEAWQLVQDETSGGSGEWNSFVQGLGIGR